jgi:C4-dicarboxylate-specific signal transduction histidine kinase
MASDLPKTMADPYQLQQVILNLIVNAEQAFSKSAARDVSVSEPAIRVTAPRIAPGNGSHSK